MNRRCIWIAGLLFILMSQGIAAKEEPEGWVELFNGRDLQGWHLRNSSRPNGWTVQSGVYVNDPPSTDIQTDQDYYDFQLHIEFNIAPGSNSGVYLRDKYEVQILDSYGKPLNVESCGALYWRIAPATEAGRPLGIWQTFDITFVGRHLTVLQNGTRVLHILDVGPNGTGNASERPDGPGSLRLQGDHGIVMFRNARLRPLSATEAARIQQEMEKER